jgi:hypothetical protein
MPIHIPNSSPREDDDRLRTAKERCASIHGNQVFTTLSVRSRRAGYTWLDFTYATDFGRSVMFGRPMAPFTQTTGSPGYVTQHELFFWP